MTTGVRRRRWRWLNHLLGAILLAFAPVESVRAAGVTIITHGFNSNVTDWIIPMASKGTAAPLKKEGFVLIKNQNTKASKIATRPMTRNRRLSCFSAIKYL